MRPTHPPVARVGGVPLHGADEVLDAAELHRRACTELLRQAALRDGLLAADDPPPAHGVISEAACGAIDAVVAGDLRPCEPADDDCRRYYAAHAARYAQGERVRLRHVLFAVTPGVDLAALRRRAEACLLDLRTASPDEAGRFAEAARTLSNCPSGAGGGDLGWLAREDCAPEFATEVFAQAEVGVLPRLVHSRFGLHVVEVLERAAGQVPPYDAVRPAVVQALQRQAAANALRRRLRRLACETPIEGLDWDAATTAPQR